MPSSDPRLFTHAVPDTVVLDSLFAADSFGFAIFDKYLRYQRVNQRLAQINGVPAEAHIGRTLPELLPHQNPIVQESLRQVLESGETLRDLEIVGETPAQPGEKRTWNVTFFPLRESLESEIIGVGVTVLEITERRREQVRRERSERAFTALVENLPDIISRFDRDLRCTYVSESVEAILGLPADYFLGKTHAEMGLSSEFCDQADSSLQRVFQTGQRDLGEFTLALPGTFETRVFEGIAMPLFGPEGRVVEAVLTTLRDVTDRSDRESRQRFVTELNERTRFVTAPEAIIWEVIRGCGEFLHLSRCLFADIDEEKQLAIVRRDWRHGNGSAKSSLAGEWPLRPDSRLLHVLREGRTVVTQDTEADPRTKGDFETVYGPAEISALVMVPLRRGGRWVAVFAAHMSNGPRDWKPEDVSLMESIAEHTWLTVENARLQRDTQDAVLRQRRFLREILGSVTEGRLRLCDTDEQLPQTQLPAADTIVLSRNTLREFRQLIQQVAEQTEMAQERILDLLTAAGEAATNAIKHAGGGSGTVCVDQAQGIVQVWIQDQGKGINEEDIHRATLEPGFSSAGTLGHGFFLMLRLCDRIFLRTGPRGTTIVLEQERTPPLPDWFSRV